MTKPYCYHIDQFAELQPIIHKVIEYGKAMGLDMIQGDHEDAPGQLELNFHFDSAEQTADNLSTYRQVCRRSGARSSAFACFMPKPFMGVSANGCHHNISLWQGDKNKFLPDREDPRKPGQIGLWAIGGILEHLGALTAITAPDRQLLQALLGHRLLGADLRGLGLPEPHDRAARVAPRAASSTARSTRRATRTSRWPRCIKAMGDGIKRKLDPGPPEERNIYEAMASRQGGHEDPDDFGEALDALEADEVVGARCPATCTRSSCTTSATSGSASSRPSATGTRGIPRRPALTARPEESTHVRHRRNHLPERPARRRLAT